MKTKMLEAMFLAPAVEVLREQIDEHVIPLANAVADRIVATVRASEAKIDDEALALAAEVVQRFAGRILTGLREPVPPR